MTTVESRAGVGAESSAGWRAVCALVERSRIASPPGLAVASALLAVASLALPSAPGYDPWSWLVWGRELVALDLSTSEGPAWKPLPVLMAAPLTAVSDELAPAGWLVVARGGAILAVLLAFSLARRLAGGSSAAGAAAAIGLLLVPGWIENAAVGNAEGLLSALLLVTLACLLAGRPRAAFAVLALGAAVRVEAWPFLAALGAALLVRIPGARVLVVSVALVVPVLWFVPELVGSGELLRSADRARVPNPGAPTLASRPPLATLATGLSLPPALALAGVGALACAGLSGWLRLRRPSALRPRPSRPRSGASEGASGVAAAERTSAVAAAGASWLLLVAAMSELGFSGEARYLLPGVVLLTVSGMAGLFLAPALLAGSGRPSPRAAGPLLVLAVALALAATGVARGDELRAGAVRASHGAALATDLERAIERAGGAEALLRCGPPAVGPYRGPMAAWALGVHKRMVGFTPARPGAVLRSRLGPQSPVAPGRPPGDPEIYARTARWEVIGNC